jgi:hypothetical protein
MKIPHASTTANLGIAGVFTSDWQRHKSLRLQGTIFADQASALQGFVVEQSPNAGVTVTHRATQTLFTGDRILFDIELTSTWVRMTYTNGGIAQTAFSLDANLVGDA